MNVHLDDLEMWAKSTGRPLYVNAYERAKKRIDKGEKIRIMWEDDLNFYIYNDQEINKRIRKNSQSGS